MAVRLLFSCLLMGASAGISLADMNAVVIDPCHPKPAKATSFGLNSQSQMGVTFTGATPTLAYQVQASSDLNNWTTVATLQANDIGSFTYVDPQSANQSSRFYRALIPVATGCAPTSTAVTAPIDPAAQALLDQISVLWQPELDRLHAATSEAQFVALLSSLKQTPLETAIAALLTGQPQGENLRQLMLSINRVPFSSGAAAHVRTLLTATSTGLGSSSANISAAVSTLQSAVIESTDPDGVQRSFLIDLMVAIPGAQMRIKTYATGQLINDTPGASTTLTADGKRLFRTELFRGYMLSDPDLATDLLPFSNQILSALRNPQDKAPILREMLVRHPALLIDYLASRPAIAIARPRQ